MRYNHGRPVMTVRDEFAMQALLGLLNDASEAKSVLLPLERLSDYDYEYQRKLAKLSYQIADAMLKARDEN